MNEKKPFYIGYGWTESDFLSDPPTEKEIRRAGYDPNGTYFYEVSEDDMCKFFIENRNESSTMTDDYIREHVVDLYKKNFDYVWAEFETKAVDTMLCDLARNDDKDLYRDSNGRDLMWRIDYKFADVDMDEDAVKKFNYTGDAFRYRVPTAEVAGVIKRFLIEKEGMERDTELSPYVRANFDTYAIKYANEIYSEFSENAYEEAWGLIPDEINPEITEEDWLLSWRPEKESQTHIPVKVYKTRMNLLSDEDRELAEKAFKDPNLGQLFKLHYFSGGEGSLHDVDAADVCAECLTMSNYDADAALRLFRASSAFDEERKKGIMTVLDAEGKLTRIDPAEKYKNLIDGFAAHHDKTDGAKTKSSVKSV